MSRGARRGLVAYLVGHLLLFLALALWTWRRGGRFRVEFKAADLWIGLYFRQDPPRSVFQDGLRHIWQVPVPMLPIHFTLPGRLCWERAGPVGSTFSLAQLLEAKAALEKGGVLHIYRNYGE